MKRKSALKVSARLGDILNSTTVEQRSWIGAVALAYNDAEDALHRIAGACLQYSGPFAAVTSRINGVDGIIAIIKEAVSALMIPTAELFDKSLAEQGFAYLKTLRDAVIHAKLLDSTIGVGEAPGKRGKRPEEVLLSSEALKGLYHRLVFIKQEFDALETILICEQTIKLYTALNAIDDLWRGHNEGEILNATAQCQRNQSQRLSLPPFPEFPDPPPVHELLGEWQMSQRDGLWFRVERRE